MERSNKSGASGWLTVAGIILLGIVFLMIRFVPDLRESIQGVVSLPLTVVGFGLLLFAFGLIFSAPSLMVPACTIGGIGALLFYQSITSDWGSWAYTWTLIPGFFGVGTFFDGLLRKTERGATLRDGVVLILISLVMFALLAPWPSVVTLIEPYRLYLLIALGLLLLAEILLGVLAKGKTRGTTAFWPTLLIIIGFVLLLQNVGLSSKNVWGLLWPLVLITFGIGLLQTLSRARPMMGINNASIPLEGATQARVQIHHGVGRLRVRSGAGEDQLLVGSFGGGLGRRTQLDGDTLDVDMRVAESSPRIWSWLRGSSRAFDWVVNLNSAIPLALDIEKGAGETRLDLADLRLAVLRLKTGASATEMILPANAGYTRVKVAAGAAAVTIHVPSDVAARVQFEAGVFGISVDAKRFPAREGTYQSPDYDTALNKADIRIESGLGAINIR